MESLGDLPKLILGAVAIYGGIRLDLAWLRHKLDNHEKRLNKLEGKSHGNKEAHQA